MRARDERGASLMIAVATMGFLAVLVPMVLTAVLSGARITEATTDDRRDLYAATSAMESAVQYGRTATWVGRFGAPCPSVTTEVGGLTGIVTCESATGPFDIDRRITYTASVDGASAVVATVVYRDSAPVAGVPAVDVLSWTSRPVSPT